MLQVGGGLDLGEEPLGAEDGGELGVQHLERDLAVVLEVVGEVHRRHAARAELALDAVAVGERGGERQGVGHAGSRGEVAPVTVGLVGGWLKMGGRSATHDRPPDPHDLTHGYPPERMHPALRPRNTPRPAVMRA